jgi:prepilin-type N-terminal cleavage/methylation domain-containing protein
MKPHPTTRRGFTLMETVIAIGVLAVLLSAFMAVFGPAAAGIRKSISAQDADRLVSSYEEELATVRANESSKYTSAFDKAFIWIRDAAKNPVLLYQYRADPSKAVRADGTMPPYASTASSPGIAGKDYVLRTAIRLRDDTLLQADLAALEGRVFTVLDTQLIFKNSQLQKGSAATIVDPASGTASSKSDDYPAAVIAFSAEFYVLPNVSYSYLKGFNTSKLTNPVIVRNLAVRR